jgi:hypothetical protein
MMMADDTALGTLESQAEGTYTGAETVDTPETQIAPEVGGEGTTAEGVQPIEGTGGEGGEGAEQRGADDLPPWEEVKDFTPKQVYETIRHLREQHADDPTTKRVLHSMTDAYGRLQGFITEFPEGVTQAREAKAILDSFGGFDGIAELQDLQETADTTDDQLRRGDPVFMQRAARAEPEGFAKLVPEAINILQKTNSEAYEHTIMGPVLKSLDGAGLAYALDQAVKELKAGTPEGIARATDWIQRTIGWHQQLQQKFEDTQKYARDPRVPELEKERAGFSQTRRDTFLNDISWRIDEYMKESFTPQIQQRARGRNISKAGLDDLVNAAMVNARSALAENNLFSSRVKAFARNQRGPDPIGRAMNVIKAQVDSIRPKSIEKVWTTRYGSVTPQRTSAQTGRSEREVQPRNGNPNQQPIYNRGQGSSADNPIPVKQMPPQAEIDITKDPDRLRLIQGRAFHKPSNRWVAWRGLPGR